MSYPDLFRINHYTMATANPDSLEGTNGMGSTDRGFMGDGEPARAFEVIFLQCFMLYSSTFAYYLL